MTKDEEEELREENRQLKAMLAPSRIEVPLSWGLTKTEALMYRALATRRVVTYEHLATIACLNRGTHTVINKSIAVRICSIRKKTGLTIYAVYGTGYRLDSEVPVS